MCGHFSWQQNNGMKKIIVEGDAKLVVDALLSSPDDVRWDIAALINDAMCLAGTFSSCKFGRIKREGNVTTHSFNLKIPQVLRYAFRKFLFYFFLFKKIFFFLKKKKKKA